MIGADLQIVAERMTGQGCMVCFDVALEVVLQPPILQEPDGGGGIIVVLVLGRLHRLGLDQKGSLEPDAAPIVPGHRQEPCKVLLLALHIGVQKTHVALAATPEDVVGTTELDVHIEAVLYLYSGTRHDIEIRIGRRPIHVVGV
ncbi:hypothetical protein SDC9_54295 [bioreactor metagenome]|uniref:Uncharacterized protein n=1 Tax=bioreactor metagenome TaxID=1076179 RepID=A0A644X1E2_9ZZZZ